MGLNKKLADNWTPAELVIIGITIGFFIILVIAILEGLDVPTTPSEVLFSVLGTIAIIMMAAGILARKNQKTGTGWTYVGD